MGTARSGDKLAEDLHAVVRDAEALLQATATQGGEKLEALRARAADSLQKARARLATLEEDAVREVREAAAATDAYVHENPWQAIGAAAGIGLLLGLLIARR
jgi:ElaB/YqjD/DUF883 family membrane-anchored ribosome-binding protein